MTTSARAERLLNATAGIMKFDYTETDVDGSFLDGEYGYIPGVEIDYRKSSADDSTVGFSFAFYSGEVDYDGALQDVSPPIDTNIDGLAFKTDTDETVFAITGFFSRKTPQIDPHLSLFGKITYKQWSRDIQGRFFSGFGNDNIYIDNQYIPGFSEVYTWLQLTLGLDYQLALSSGGSLQFNAGLLRTLNPEMEADFGVVTGNYDLQERWGYEAGITWLIPISPVARVGVAGNYTYWEFGRSNVVFGFVEPDSESKMTTFKLVYQSKL
jgi:hypothetical protein